jgi:hypothetical protein
LDDIFIVTGQDCEKYKNHVFKGRIEYEGHSVFVIETVGEEKIRHYFYDCQPLAEWIKDSIKSNELMSKVVDVSDSLSRIVHKYSQI